MRPTLFQAAGGGPAILALARAHHARCLADTELNHPFSHPDQHPQHVERLAAYWAEVLGGPDDFSRTCSDQSAMLQLHAGNGPGMHDLGSRFVDCFDKAADDACLPNDPDLRTALHGYMVWAVAAVNAWSEPGATVPAGLAMPSWTWDGLAPH